MNNNISFIYFDVGGVVIKDFSGTDKWNGLLSEWGIPEQRKTEVSKRYDLFEDEVNVGREVDDFVPILKSEFKVKLPDSYSLLKDFVDRFSKNTGLAMMLEELSNKYDLGLLTNMYPGMLNLIKERRLLPNINWKVVIDSSKVRCKKPEPEIYKMAEKLAGVAPGSILFVDNKQKNTETAAKLGWKTYWYDSKGYEKSTGGLRLLLK